MAYMVALLLSCRVGFRGPLGRFHAPTYDACCIGQDPEGGLDPQIPASQCKAH